MKVLVNWTHNAQPPSALPWYIPESDKPSTGYTGTYSDTYSVFQLSTCFTAECHTVPSISVTRINNPRLFLIVFKLPPFSPPFKNDLFRGSS